MASNGPRKRIVDFKCGSWRMEGGVLCYIVWESGVGVSLNSSNGGRWSTDENSGRIDRFGRIPEVFCFFCFFCGDT